MARALGHIMIALVLTVLTQIGGAVWLLALVIARSTTRLGFLISFLITYTAATTAAHYATPLTGRVAIPCMPQTAKAETPFLFCALNRNYVTPEMLALLDSLAAEMAASYPGSRTRVLDASFPAFDGFPLLPHLSHDDGQKADLAFWYQGEGLRSHFGYWAFEPGRGDCPDTPLSLRWNMGLLQPLMRDLPLDEPRTRHALNWLASNAPAGSKILLEPHLRSRLNLTHQMIRFQGCRAARHDDHIHLQLPS